MDGGRRWAIPHINGALRRDRGLANRAAYVEKQEGRSTVGGHKGKSPYYFNSNGDISITMRGEFLRAMRSRLVNRLSFLLNPILILGWSLVGKIYNGGQVF